MYTRTVCVFILALSTALVAGCNSGPSPTTPPSPTPIVAAVVNDSCSQHSTPDACRADTSNGCSWIPVGAACPAGASCPEGVCVTPDPCGQIKERVACQADDRCAWSAMLAASAAILCPAGQDCTNDGFCHGRDLSGGGCACVQPVACPPNAECPAVQCDCSAGTGSSGGGTCTCACPPCAPGESCAPCNCDCAGGSSGGGGGTGCGQGTCTCACPACAPGQTCPPCDCACGAGVIGVSGTGTAAGGATTGSAGSSSGCACPTCPPNTACAPCDCPPPQPPTTPPPNTDPCSALTGAETCNADSADRCVWYALGIPCIEGQPCRSGVCQQAPVPPPPDACAAHTDAQSCSADAANMCGWVELGIACFTDPCPPNGRCVEMKPVPGGGGGGCGCACPACVSGQTCPPCACNCCPGPTPMPPAQPNASGASSGAG